MSRYLRTGDAARVLGVSPDTIRHWIERGDLYAHRFDNVGWYLIDAVDLERMRRLLRSGAPTPDPERVRV